VKRYLGFALAILFLGVVSPATGQEDCPSVADLKRLIAEDGDFRTVVLEMFENLQPMPDSSPNPWQGKSLDDLYEFLNEWYRFLPNRDDGLDRIIEFSLLYRNNPAGLRFVLEEPGLSWTLSFVEARGQFMDSEASAEGIQPWLDDPAIRNEDFVQPVDGFKSFNDFFIRDLRPGARAITGIDDDSVVVSPADGILNIINNDLRSDSQIPMKGRMSLNLSQLLEGSVHIDQFIGGTAVACFLLPDNYHHFHAPVSGVVTESKESVGDRLFGMHDIIDMFNKGNPGYNRDFSVFERFRHGYFIIETPSMGHVAVVPVGLQTVGSVVFEEKFKSIEAGPGRAVYKGEKLGHFAYGGSTVFLLFEKGQFNAIKVRQGQQVGIASGASGH